MKTTKISLRASWILANRDAIDAARKATNSHADCRGYCRNGRTCKTQSGSGWGHWAAAFDRAGVRCDRMAYWSGYAPTPSTSINRGIAKFIRENAPESIL